MKRYCDIHLQPNLNEMEETTETICKAADLGYNLVAVSLPIRSQQNTIRFLRTTCEEYDLEFSSRVDLNPKSSAELLRVLRQIRRRFELVSVNCISKSVARQAAKDHRVDLLVFPSIRQRRRFFDHAEARLAAQGVSVLEVNMDLLLRSSGSSRVRLLSWLRRETTIAEKLGVSIVISSNAKNPYQLRSPQDLACLATLFGMNKASALNAVSVTPLKIIMQNRRKLDPSYIAEGMRVVRRGQICGE